MHASIGRRLPNRLNAPAWVNQFLLQSNLGQEMIHDAEEHVLSSDRVRGRRQLRTAGQESYQGIGSEGGSTINNVLVTRVGSTA